MGSRVPRGVDGLLNRINPLLDDIRSEAGGEALIAAAGAGTTVFTIPTGKVFHIRNWQIYLSGAAGVVTLYASGAGGTAVTLLRNALANGATRAVTDLEGWRIIASTGGRHTVRASSTAGRAFVRVGGVLRNRHSGQTTT